MTLNLVIIVLNLVTTILLNLIMTVILKLCIFDNHDYVTNTSTLHTNDI